MKSNIKCNSCNRVLNEDQTEVAWRRNRCPKCGMKDSLEVDEYTWDPCGMKDSLEVDEYTQEEAGEDNYLSLISIIAYVTIVGLLVANLVVAHSFNGF